jgi:predicted transcriptional regulator
MNASTTMTIRVSQDVKDKLGRLADETRRSRSYLAAEAVSAYVERELEIIEGVQRGLADVEAGRVVPHDAAMDQLDAMIASTRARTA